MENPRITLHEMQTVYSLEDVYDLVEVAMVRVHNEHLRLKRQRALERQRG